MLPVPEHANALRLHARFQTAIITHDGWDRYDFSSIPDREE
jgi:hypothetical protein